MYLGSQIVYFIVYISPEHDPLGMKSKILIKNFLTDKKEGLELFFGFLNGAKLWPRVSISLIIMKF